MGCIGCWIFRLARMAAAFALRFAEHTMYCGKWLWICWGKTNSPRWISRQNTKRGWDDAYLSNLAQWFSCVCPNMPCDRTTVTRENWVKFAERLRFTVLTSVLGLDWLALSGKLWFTGLMQLKSASTQTWCTDFPIWTMNFSVLNFQYRFLPKLFVE